MGITYQGFGAADTSDLETGDIIFHSSNSSQSKAVSIATRSKYTHMGMIVRESGRIYVLEAVQPVKMTPFDEWVKRGKGGRYVVKRVAGLELSEKQMAELKKEAKAFIGKGYDIYFGWDDTLIYCSELVWKAYDRALGIRIGPVKKMKDFNLSHPVVKNMMKKRYGDKIPLEEIVISPEDMFEAENLEIVIKK